MLKPTDFLLAIKQFGILGTMVLGFLGFIVWWYIDDFTVK
jgi:hypothetical protein